MEVILHDVSKSFGRETIFQHVRITFPSGSRTVILGPNGSGKSTLLQLIAGAIAPTQGRVDHLLAGGIVPQDEVYRHVSMAAPYLGLYEDLPLESLIGMHARFKPFRQGIDKVAVARLAYLDHALQKPVMQFSSGMKQRLKLALAILSDTPLLLLDEPASNLDAQAVEWYRQLLSLHLEGRTLLVASNRQPKEHDMCGVSIEMEGLRP